MNTKLVSTHSVHIPINLDHFKPPTLSVIPYDKVFLDPVSDPVPTRIRLQATITSLSPHSLTLSRSFPEHGIIPDSEGKNTLHFDYAIYALGSHLPAPLNFWDPCHSLTTDASNKAVSEELNGYNGTKAEGIMFLKRAQMTIEKSQSILIVGGGALGIRMYSSCWYEISF